MLTLLSIEAIFLLSHCAVCVVPDYIYYCVIAAAALSWESLFGVWKRGIETYQDTREYNRGFVSRSN